MAQLGMKRGMRLATEFGLFLLIGVFLGAIAPYGTVDEPVVARYAFWISTVVIGGALGVAADRLLLRWIDHRWPRTLAVSVATTVPITAIVLAAMIVLFGHPHRPFSAFTVSLLWEVLLITLAMMATRTLVSRPPRHIVEQRTVVAPPLPDAEANFRSRLSAKRRAARLFAVEAHDHYVRVHTDAGVELLTLRFADAVAELAGAHGYRVHRSWWVAGDAIKAGRWRRGSGELEVEGALTVPVSRSGAPELRAAGWL